ncbi:MAG: hypothetical protein MN733_40145 [Nitrososphaera sp.]|nr:hypothetical protein [Nitrososphaera sp.]
MSVTWNNRDYHVTRMNRTWCEAIGGRKIIHVAVETDEGTTMQLVVDPSEMSWRLEVILV